MSENYYFIGIKGAGMSALALMLHDTGNSVSGSDVTTHYFTQDKLDERNIALYTFEDTEHILQADVVICGNAFPDTHPQIAYAKEQNLRVVRYHDFLGEVASRYQSIAVTGTHGKTTTTGMLAHILTDLRPSGYLIGDGTGYLTKDAEYFAFEACEYRNHFHAYTPDYAIVTNVDFDHPDFFKDLSAVKKTFSELGKKVKKGLIVCGDDENARTIDFGEKKVIYYGLSDFNHVRAENVSYTDAGIVFDLVVGLDRYENQMVPFFGEHMLQNALAVIATSVQLGISVKEAIASLVSFGGVARRFSEENIGSNIIIDDYAHHPKEIEVTLKAIRQKYPTKSIVAIFQPHTFSRTEALMDEFVASLSKADTVYLLDIFGSAREDAGEISSKDIASNIPNGHVLENNEVSILSDIEESVIVFMGAGNVNELIDVYKKQKMLK
ncbi:MAG: UDP-N-acetylmuramate--L-alanine ligase [Culicoidibacterales bacterium]